MNELLVQNQKAFTAKLNPEYVQSLLNEISQLLYWAENLEDISIDDLRAFFEDGCATLAKAEDLAEHIRNQVNKSK